MISKVTVFHRGGAVLWTSDEESNIIKDDALTDTSSLTSTSTTATATNDGSLSCYAAINKLIQSVLLSERSGQDSMNYDSFTLKWTFENNLDLVFVAVYFSFQKLLYVDDLLKMIKEQFIKMFNETLKGGIINMVQEDYSKFYQKYKKIQKYFQTSYKSTSIPKQFGDTKRGKEHQLFTVSDKKNNSSSSNRSASKDKDDGDDDHHSGEGIEGGNTIKGIGRFGRKPSKGPRQFDPNKKSKGKNKNKNKNKKNKKGKGKNKDKPHWSEFNAATIGTRKISQKQIDELNMCEDEVGNGEEDILGEEVNGTANFDESSSDESSDDDFSDILKTDDGSSSTTNGGGFGSGIWNKFSKLIGNKALESCDIEPVLNDLENILSSKNVANVIARELCSSLKKELIGKKIGTFSSIKNVVNAAMTESLERILSSSRPINVLHGIRSAKEEKRPYSIVFIGVNGVGKSTSLSKVIYYLKSRNLKVSVAACDTFRSGAVEQLKTHCRALKVRLFSQGYARDASSVAYRAIEDAKKNEDDVVLIDTAGRMQNNQPLMRSLVSLIQKNRPDLILFVGEALVGNDGIDQLCEFDKALKINNNSRTIDGIILTKFDTVDDKVGAAISMTYKSRKPIVFIGTGQTYKDLKRMHCKSLINKLLK